MLSTNDKKDRSIFFKYCFFITHNRHFKKNIVYIIYIWYIMICYLNESLFCTPEIKVKKRHNVFIQPVIPFETVILLITFKQRGLELYYTTWMTRPFLGTNIPDNTFYFYWLSGRVFTSNAGDRGSIPGRDIQVN